MIRRTYLLLLVTLLLAPARGNADDTYTIKIKETGIGDKTQAKKKSTEKSLFKLEDSQGNVLQEKNETVVENYTYQVTLLEKPAGKKKATRLRRSYDLAEITKGDDKQTLPYQGKTVLIEKKGDRFHFQIEGGDELTGKDAEFLEKEFNKKKEDELDFTKILLPKKPVRVEESWELDIQALSKDLEKTSGVVVDVDNAKAVAKLVKAYKKDGHQFGVITLHLDFPIKAFKMGDMKITLDQAATFVADATMDGCIDGSLSGGTATMTMRMEGQGEIAQGEMKFKLTFKTNLNGEESEKELAGK